MQEVDSIWLLLVAQMSIVTLFEGERINFKGVTAV